MKNGQAELACPKFEESQKLDPGAEKFNLADCYEKVGKAAAAYRNFQELDGILTRVGDTERAALARSRAEALKAQMGRFKFEAPREKRPEGLVVIVDDVPLDPARLSEELAVDVGPHRVEFRATSKKTVTAPHVAAAGKLETIDLPSFENEKSDVESPAPVEHTSGSGRRTAGLVIGGVGAAALVGGVVIGFISKSKFDEATENCRDQDGTFHCAPGSDRVSQADSAKSLATVGTIVGGVGAVGLIVGGIMFFTAPKKSRDTGWSFDGSATPNGASVGARLNF